MFVTNYSQRVFRKSYCTNKHLLPEYIRMQADMNASENMSII